MTKDYKSHARLCYERDDILEFQFIFYDEMSSKSENHIYSDYQKLDFVQVLKIVRKKTRKCDEFRYGLW